MFMDLLLRVSDAGPTMISEEWSCSFQVFLRSGLAVNDYPGSPYPKKHLQGTPTSMMIDT